MISKQTQQALEQRYYPQLQETVFGRFEARFGDCLARSHIVLDAGSGPGSWVLQAQRKRIPFLIGEDVYVPSDRSGLDAFVLARSEQLPLADHSLDMIVAYLMIEHLPEPILAFREFARVLKPGGYFCFKTPAVRTPLFLLAKLLPTRVHRRLKTRIGTEEGDIFPTYYRANTVGDLERDLTAAGFRRDWLHTVDQTYAYLSHTTWTYTLGLLYSRLTEARSLAWLRNQIIGVYRLEERNDH